MIRFGNPWRHSFIRLETAELSLWPVEFLTLDQIILNANYHLLLEDQRQRELQTRNLVHKH